MVKGLEALKIIENELKFYYQDEWGITRYSKDIEIIKKELEVLAIIYSSPFIIDNLVELGKLPPEAKKRYLFGTIPNADVEKVEEFFKNGEK